MKSNFLMSLTPRAKSCKTTLAKLDLKPQQTFQNYQNTKSA